MERSYNRFVDNGLYVLSYYINKPIENITYSDIENNIAMMCEKIEEYLKCERYSKMKTTMFQNSALTNGAMSIGQKLPTFLNYKGHDICNICGKPHADSHGVKINRAYFPNITADTFYNYSNNLKGVNICPYCIILTMFSILNVENKGSLIIYNSPSNDFMEDYTLLKQEENQTNIFVNAKEDKSNSNQLLLRLLENYNLYDDFVEQYIFRNSCQEQYIKINSIESQEVRMLQKIIHKGYLNEFNQYHLMEDLISGKLSNTYLYKIYDFSENKLKCSRELLNILNEVIGNMSDKEIEVVSRVSDKISESLDVSVIIKKIKLLKNKSEFESLLIDLKEKYREEESDSLFEADDYLILTNYKKYNQIKNLLLVNLV